MLSWDSAELLASEISPFSKQSPVMATGLLGLRDLPSFLGIWMLRWWLRLENHLSWKVFIGGFLSDPPPNVWPFHKKHFLLINSPHLETSRSLSIFQMLP